MCPGLMVIKHLIMSFVPVLENHPIRTSYLIYTAFDWSIFVLILKNHPIRTSYLIYTSFDWSIFEYEFKTRSQKFCNCDTWYYDTSVTETFAKTDHLGVRITV